MQVIEGEDVARAINSEYGEKPNQGQIQSHGNGYLKEFPRLSFIRRASRVAEKAAAAEGEAAAEATELR